MAALGYWCIAGLKRFWWTLVHFFGSTNYRQRIFCTLLLEMTKFSTIMGLAKSHLFPEFCELWSGVLRYHAATCISPSLMHLFCYFLVFFYFCYRVLDKPTQSSL